MGIGDRHFPSTSPSSGGGSALKYDGTYINSDTDSGQVFSFITVDTTPNGQIDFNLRDVDHAAGMHYFVRIDAGYSAVHIQPEAGSTKKLEGWLAGVVVNSAPLKLTKVKGEVRIKPLGSDWVLY